MKIRVNIYNINKTMNIMQVSQGKEETLNIYVENGKLSQIKYLVVTTGRTGNQYTKPVYNRQTSQNIKTLSLAETHNNIQKKKFV